MHKFYETNLRLKKRFDIYIKLKFDGLSSLKLPSKSISDIGYSM